MAEEAEVIAVVYRNRIVAALHDFRDGASWPHHPPGESRETWTKRGDRLVEIVEKSHPDEDLVLSNHEELDTDLDDLYWNYR